MRYAALRPSRASAVETGLDYYSLAPSEAKAQGASFVVRYLSGVEGKDLTAFEAKELANLHIDSVVVWEREKNQALNGYLEGQMHAHTGLKLALAAGMVGSRPIYFAVDFDTTVYDYPKLIQPYFEGARSVLGIERMGAYGGVTTIATLFDAGLIKWGWQTSAWSSEGHPLEWDPRAQMHQVEYDRNWDRDVALTPDFGQWIPGEPPPYPPKPPFGWFLLPAEKVQVQDYQKYVKHPVVYRHHLAACRAELIVMRKAIWMAANNDGLTPEAWKTHNRSLRWNLIAAIVPPEDDSKKSH